MKKFKITFKNKDTENVFATSYQVEGETYLFFTDSSKPFKGTYFQKSVVEAVEEIPNEPVQTFSPIVIR